MSKDIVKYGEKEYQLSTVNLDGLLETMIFPIKDGIVSGREVYCFRTVKPGESMEKHGDIFYHPEKYLSKDAITRYLREKEEIYGACDFDRQTALNTTNLNELFEYIDKAFDRTPYEGSWITDSGERVSCDIGYAAEWWYRYMKPELIRKFGKE